MTRPRSIVPLLCALLFASAAHAFSPPNSPFQVSLTEDRIEAAEGKSFKLGVAIQAPEGYYLYADETDVDFVSLEGLFITNISYPAPTLYQDPFLKKTVKVYRGDVEIAIDGTVPDALAPGEKELTAVVSFRGCSPTLCYRPEERVLSVHVAVLPKGTEVPGAKGEEPRVAPEAAPREEVSLPVSLPERLGLRHLLQVQDFSVLLEQGALFALLVVFLAGVLTSLTPCVWPVIPLVLLFVGVHPHKRLRENLLLAFSLVAGIVLTYALLGVIAVAVGKNLGFLFQQRWFLALVVVFFVAMSLSMFGVFEIRMPPRWHARLHRLGGKGYRGAFLAGVGMGLVASPCSGPVLAALLGYVALAGSYVLGFLLLIVYGAGMGLIMLILGTAYGELAGTIRGGRWMLWVRRALALVLLVPAAYYMGSLFRWTGGDVAPEGAARIHWLLGEREAFAVAEQTKSPIMMEFTAAWCPPCGALEERFFSRADIARLAGDLVPLRIDATVETPQVRSAISRYRVVGWPTVLFLSPGGKAYEDLRVQDYDPPGVERGMREAIRRAAVESASPAIESVKPPQERLPR